MNATLTAGRAAKLCGFSGKMVRKWCDEGLIPSFRLPPPLRPDRKILVSDLIQFLRSRSCPVSQELLDQDR